MQGKIIKQISNDYTVKVDDKIIVCKARGLFRKLKITPLVGDNVIIDEHDKCILEILPRTNELVRPTIANVDQAVIVTSVEVPEFSSNLLNKLLTIIEFNNIKPIIYFSKLDLISNEYLSLIMDIIRYYRSIGYSVYTDYNEIKNIFKDKITVFTGQSGAGKSTLLNKLDSNLNLEVNEVSYALGRGKHTTRHTELLEVLSGYIADTPGFSSLTFNDMTNSDIRDNFIEFNKYRELCEYSDCMHNSEENCQVKKMVEENKILKSRYEDYLNFINRRVL